MSGLFTCLLYLAQARLLDAQAVDHALLEGPLGGSAHALVAELSVVQTPRVLRELGRALRLDLAQKLLATRRHLPPLGQTLPHVPRLLTHAQHELLHNDKQPGM